MMAPRPPMPPPPHTFRCPRCGGGPYVVRPLRWWVKSSREWFDRPRVCAQCNFGNDSSETSNVLVFVLLGVLLAGVLVAIVAFMLVFLARGLPS